MSTSVQNMRESFGIAAFRLRKYDVVVSSTLGAGSLVSAAERISKTEHEVLSKPLPALGTPHALNTSKHHRWRAVFNFEFTIGLKTLVNFYGIPKI